MRFYNIDARGKIWVQRTVVPGWTEADEGRILYDTGGNEPYIGDNTAFRKIWTEGNDGPGSGLDADTLDGLDAGNDSGEIPISNGTVNTNLNAALLNGVDGSSFLTESSDPTITGDWEFTEPVVGVAPVLDAHLTPKEYVDDQDAATLVAANAYADVQDTATLVAANAYTDAAVGAIPDRNLYQMVRMETDGDVYGYEGNLYPAYGILVTWKFVMPPDPITLHCFGSIMMADGGDGYVRFSIAGLYSDVEFTTSSSWSYRNFNTAGGIDCSALTPGTTYDLAVEGLRTNHPGFPLRIREVMIHWGN